MALACQINPHPQQEEETTNALRPQIVAGKKVSGKLLMLLATIIG